MRAGAESVLSCFHATAEEASPSCSFFLQLRENFSVDSTVKNEYSKEAFQDFSNWLLLGAPSR